MTTLNIGIAGLGTVGIATLKLLQQNRELIKARSGVAVIPVKVASRRLREGVDLGDASFQTEVMALATDPDIDVVVELLGGIDLSRRLILAAIDNGKQLVTANKALLAIHGKELLEAANRNKTTLAFEASVAGGIPIIRSFRDGLSANRIQWFAGIINGTSNYILTQMALHGRHFDEALAEAQQLGYAEADPSFDIEGTDAAHKLAILAKIAFAMDSSFEAIYVEGIERVEPIDIVYARELGFVIKSLGIARRTERGVELRVHPTLIPKTQLLAHIDGVMNAVMVYGNAVGPTLYYGGGAGGEATASSVVADLVAIARGQGYHPWEASCDGDLQSVIPIEAVTSSYYLRLRTVDKPGVLSRLSSLFGKHEVNVESLIQKHQQAEQGQVPVVIVSGKTLEANIDNLINEIKAMPEILGELVRLRVESLE